jgi:hypothetical protein
MDLGIGVSEIAVVPVESEYEGLERGSPTTDMRRILPMR